MSIADGPSAKSTSRPVNRINGLRCRLHGRYAQATAMQQRCSHLVHYQLNAQLARVLEQACSLFRGQLLIDRLVLKVGVFTPAQFDAQFVHRVIRELEQQLALVLSSKALPMKGQTLHLFEDCSGVLMAADDSSAVLAQSLAGKQEELTHALPAQKPILDDAVLLSEFLLTGCLREPGRWQKVGGADAWLGELLAAPATSLLTALAHACLVKPSLQRLLQGFAPATLQRLVTLLASAIGRQVNKLTLAASPSLTLSSADPSSLILAALMYFQRHPQMTIPLVDKALLSRLPSELLRCGEWQALLGEEAPTNTRLSDWLQAIRDVNRVEVEQVRAVEAGITGLDASQAKKLAGPHADLSATTFAPSICRERSPVRMAVESPTAFEVEVCNAGVVLLWPLLARLFTECGWLQREEGIGRLLFVDASARQAAVCLLDHLTWDEGPAGEWRSVLNKWLCGVPFEQVLEPLQLSREVLGAGERYLEMFHTQVAALSRCSLTDVRAMFLQRPGLLTKTGNDWRLQVQNDPSDILLSDIPWPMGEVMLPWLESTLPIEWLRN